MTPPKAATCPACGAAGTGKFCAECGAALGSAPCPSCQGPLSPGARFCHLCGTPLGGARRAPAPRSRPDLPWIVAGIAIVALLVVIVVWRSGPTPVPAPAASLSGGPQAPFAGSGMAPAPDISSMSPRERADRLFDRIMAANEQGDTTQVRFFQAMALDAYRLIGPLDEDARYHVGLIQLVTGNVAGARAQADSLERGAPTHLFGPLLRGEIARRAGNPDGLDRAYRDFLARYEAAMAAGRQEYQLHGTAIEAFRTEARRAVGSGS